MSVTVTVRKRLDALWATDDQFAAMSDEHIVDLCLADPYELTNGAQWTIERDGDDDGSTGAPPAQAP